MAYATLDDLKSALGITTTTDDTLLQGYLDQAQAYIERYTGRVFEADADTTRYFDAVEDTDGRWLYLDADLCALTSVVNGDGVDVTAAVVTEPVNTTPWFALKLKASSGYAWTYTGDPEAAIAVTGRWAYSVTPPADIVYVTIRLASWMYRARTNPEADRPIVTAQGPVLEPSRIPADAREILERYRRRV